MPSNASDRSIESCFIIGPIGDRLAPYGTEERQKYEDAIQVLSNIIEPACQAVGLNPVRADAISQTGEIPEQAFLHIRDDDLVIADLTGGNPNVMYELGLRHTTNKLTIQIGERGRLPFDITVIRTIQFIRHDAGFIEARDSLIDTIRTSMMQGGMPVTATRLWLGLSEVPPAIPEIEVPDEEEPGFLDILAESEEALPLFSRAFEEVIALFNGLDPLTAAAQEEMAKSDARGGGAGGRLRIANQLAADLEEPTKKLEQLAADVVGELARIDPGMAYMIGRIEEEPETRNEEGVDEFMGNMQELGEAAEPALRQVGELADTVAWLGTVSKRLRPVTRRMSTALRRIADSSHVIQEWAQRLDSLDGETA